MNYQGVRKNTRNVTKFIITIPATPTIVIILFFYCMPGTIARDPSSPPTNPPMWAMPSIEEPIENNNENTTMIPITQVRLERTCP